MTYPRTPGFARGSATSFSAAQAIAPQLRALHHLVLSVYGSRGALTPDAVADILGVHWARVRPRCTELCEPAWGCLLEKTGDNGISALGNPQAILRLSDEGQQYVKRHVSSSVHAPTVAATESDSPQLLLGISR